MRNEGEKLNNIEQAGEAERTDFFHNFEQRNDIAMVFLKGGKWGGLEPDVKEKMTNQLSRWFEVVEGEEKKPSFEEISARWGKGYLKYPSFDVMREGGDFDEDFLNKGEAVLSGDDEAAFKEWLDQARQIAGDNVGLLRTEMLLAYYASGGQNVLLRLKDDVSRQKIFEDLGLADRACLEKAVGQKRADLEWCNEEKVSLQEFVKRIVVGETTAYDAAPGTLRSIVAEKMKNKGLVPCAELWEEPSDDWALRNKLNDPKLVASNLLNAVHAAGSAEELVIECRLLSDNDTVLFSEALSGKTAKNELMEVPEIPEYDLEKGIEALVGAVSEKINKRPGPVVVEVAGGSASGKTSAVAAKVKEIFGDEAVIFSIDDYYKGRTFMDAEVDKGNVLNWDQPEAVGTAGSCAGCFVISSAPARSRPTS